MKPMRLSSFLAVSTCLGFACACAVDVDSTPTEGSEPIADSPEAATGANPITPPDAQLSRELPELPAGVDYTGIAVADSLFYLARSDDRVETRDFLWGELKGTTVGVGKQIDWVDLQGWGVVAAQDSTQRIIRNATNVGTSIGSYPGGVTKVQALAVAPVPGSPTRVKIYVIHGNSPNQVLQVGEHNRHIQPFRISWEYVTTPAGAYSKGLTYGSDGTTTRLFRIQNYETSPFRWYSPTAPYTSGYETHLAPYTEHCYSHPEGQLDKFAPVSFDYHTGGYFFGLDRYHNSLSGRSAWVVARLHRSMLRP